MREFFVKRWRIILLLFLISLLLTIAVSLLAVLVWREPSPLRYFGLPRTFYRIHFLWPEGVSRDFYFFPFLADLLFWFLAASSFYWLKKRLRLGLLALFLIWAGIASVVGSLWPYKSFAKALNAPYNYLAKHVEVFRYPGERYTVEYLNWQGEREAVVHDFYWRQGKPFGSELIAEERAELGVLLDRFEAENPKPTVEEVLGVWKWTLHPIGDFFYTLALSVLSWGIVGLIITGVGKLGLKGFQRLKCLRVARG